MKDYVQHILKKDLKDLSLFERQVISEEQRFLRDGFSLGPIQSYVDFLNSKIKNLDSLSESNVHVIKNLGKVTRRDLMQCHIDIVNNLGDIKEEYTYGDIYRHANDNVDLKERLNKALHERIKYMKSINQTK